MKYVFEKFGGPVHQNCNKIILGSPLHFFLFRMRSMATLPSVLIFMMMALSFSAVSQIKSSDVRRMLESNQYEMVLDHLKKGTYTSADSGYFLYAKGLSLLQTGKEVEALSVLKRAVAYYSHPTAKNDVGLDVWFSYAQAQHANYLFEEAKNTYNELKTKLDPRSQKQLDAINRELAFCEAAIRLSQSPVDFKITNLGKAFNTVNDEHSPVVTLDENQIIFTSNRLSKKNTPIENLYSSIWREGKWLPARKLTGQLSQYANNASVSVSHDGNMLILYGYNGKSGNLYYSVNHRGNWSAPVKFPAPVNSGYSETHASLSVDGRTIYFSSDRPGGFGGKDIYFSRILPNGHWGPAQNMGPLINTAFDEESPFIMPDGKTLYFASEGHENMGGYDIFKTIADATGQWAAPENIGFPINTPGDDLFYCPTADGLRVYYASTREGTTGNTDLFLIEYPSDSDKRMAVVSGFLFEKVNVPAGDAEIMVETLDDMELTGFYKPNPQNGKYVLVLQAGVKYQIVITKEGFESTTIQYQVPYKGEFGSRSQVNYIDPIILNPIKTE